MLRPMSLSKVLPLVTLALSLVPIQFTQALNQTQHASTSKSATATTQPETTQTNANCDPAQIIGKWEFFEYIYEGKVHPPMNPNLTMHFEFFANSNNRLHWTRKGNSFFCERNGRYIYNQCQLLDEVVSTNPKNGPGCGSDPDMQVGNRTVTQLDFNNGNLQLHLTLSGKPFIYVWKRIEEESGKK